MPTPAIVAVEPAAYTVTSPGHQELRHRHRTVHAARAREHVAQLTAVSSSALTASSASVKPSFTGVTVIVSVEVSSVPDPSVTVYVATGTGPL